ncbi:uncharacterized protein L201_007001 [Kwoniella dendrophila CBS 6074]|uniref:Capsular associated protein n=1 Tax=Kwoniella dendrophila CBS 6074 TaxID=1295534 RepID=A0AAX4K3B7_9TREE
MDYTDQNTHHHTQAIPRSPPQHSTSTFGEPSNNQYPTHSRSGSVTALAPSISLSSGTSNTRSRKYPSPLHSPPQLSELLPDSPTNRSTLVNSTYQRYLPTNIMRVSRNNAKTYLNLSIAFNILFLIAIFLPSEHAHNIVGDKAWGKIEQYGLLNNRWGGASQDLLSTNGVSQLPLQSAKTCSMCEVNPEFCEEFGEDNLTKALGFLGTNNRLRRALVKMRSGQPFSVGVIGGSVSKGHGLDAPDGDNAHTPKNLNRIIFDHLNDLFPNPKGIKTGSSGRSEGKNTFVNGAQGGMGTDYFSLCFNEHIPEDVDLVLIELSINDEVLIRNMNTYELLVRGLYDLPNQPAVMNLQIFALMFQYVANGGDLHHGIAQYYDVPTVSVRNPVLPQVLRNTTMVRHLFHNRVKDLAWKDPLEEIDLRHLSWQGHELMGKIASTYIDKQLCEMDRIEAALGDHIDYEKLYPIEPLPRAPIMKKYSPDSNLPKLAPQCYSANALKHPLKPSESKGWRHWNWKEKHYLIADEPGSKVSFPISTTLGQVQLHYLRSYQYNLGSAVCWIDDDKSKSIKLDGYWKEPYNIGRAATIRDDLKPGDHVLHCELSDQTADPKGGHEFRIISVMR